MARPANADQFLTRLGLRIKSFQNENVQIPSGLYGEIREIVCSGDDLFRNETFVLGAQHLLDGLDPRLLNSSGGNHILEERLAALAANLRNLKKQARS